MHSKIANMKTELLYLESVKKHLLKTHRQVYCWNDIPLSVFIEAKIFKSHVDQIEFKQTNKDRENSPINGCDILYYDEKDNKWLAVYCEKYNRDELIEFFQFIDKYDLLGYIYTTE